jgi:hypothetical protein
MVLMRDRMNAGCPLWAPASVLLRHHNYASTVPVILATATLDTRILKPVQVYTYVHHCRCK